MGTREGSRRSISGLPKVIDWLKASNTNRAIALNMSTSICSSRRNSRLEC